MKRLAALLFAALIALGVLPAHAQERVFNQAELDALLAPIALYPDPLLANVLDASRYPQDVQAAAAWARANPQLAGDAALATVQGTPWAPSVKALAAYPDVLIRMAESPQWLADLGAAYAGIPQYVDATVQQLRARASAAGTLRSDEYQSVYQQGPAIVVQPVYPHLIVARYYDPYVVYGAWWWPAYRPVHFRPWVARPVVVTRYVQPVRTLRKVEVVPYHRVPESQRAPIVQSMPAPGGWHSTWSERRHEPQARYAAPRHYVPSQHQMPPARGLSAPGKIQSHAGLRKDLK